MTKFALALACLIGTAPLVQAQETPSDPLTPLRFLVGEWRGTTSGEHGTGTVARRYRFILSGQFLQERSMASFPPQPQQPDGAVFSHASFLLYDGAEKAMLFRILHQERFNGTFRLSPAQSRPTRLVFESVQFDNLPASWKALETIEVVSPNEYIETFQAAEAGKPLALQSRITFKRHQP
jgi:hypothetical protein